MKTSLTRRLCALALVAFACTQLPAAPVLIGNKNVSGEKLDSATLKSVFLGKKVSWDGAGRITLAVLKGGSVTDEFLKDAVGMTSSAFNNHWRRLAMTGGGTAPKSFESEEDLRKFVAETPGAIGFIESAHADDSVVVLTPAS